VQSSFTPILGHRTRTTHGPLHGGHLTAVNDTVRELGGALGVAVIGSIAATSYASSLRSELTDIPGLTDSERSLLTDNVGAALHMSGQLGANGAEIASLARTAFVNSMSASLWVAAAFSIGATAIAAVYLPRQARTADTTGHGHQKPVHGHGAPVGSGLASPHR
jgi:hypothetical protein